MSKVSDALINALKAKFETGDIPDGPDFSEFLDAVQEAAQDHEHRYGGGPGSGTGDATPVANVQHGTEFSRPSTPNVGDVYVETDTFKFYVCYVQDAWTQV